MRLLIPAAVLLLCCPLCFAQPQSPPAKLPEGYKLLEVPTRDAPEDCFMTPYDIDIIWIFVDAEEKVRRLAVARSIRFYGFAQPGSVTVAVPEKDFKRVQAARRFGQLVLGRSIPPSSGGEVSIKTSFPQALRSIGRVQAGKTAEEFEQR